MLIEIKCDALNFKGEVGEDKKTINFHQGLNTIIGDIENNQFVLLMMIEYCFGGDRLSNYYINTSEEYTVCFAFMFQNTKCYFSRHTSYPKEVNVCDENYCRQKSLSINDYKKRLMEYYGIKFYDAGLWRYISKFFRFYNDEEHAIYNAENKIYIQDIINLEKVFGFYREINHYKIELKRYKDKKEVYDKVIV